MGDTWEPTKVAAETTAGKAADPLGIGSNWPIAIPSSPRPPTPVGGHGRAVAVGVQLMRQSLGNQSKLCADELVRTSQGPPTTQASKARWARMSGVALLRFLPKSRVADQPEREALEDLLGSCSPSRPGDNPPSPEAPIGDATLLPPAAYFLVLDSLLARANPEKQPTFVHGALSITRAELQARHVQYRENLSVCPGEVALWFLPPAHRAAGTTEPEVVQAFGIRGLAGSPVFVFRCSDRMCRLVRALPGESDRLVVCGSPGGH